MDLPRVVDSGHEGSFLRNGLLTRVDTLFTIDNAFAKNRVDPLHEARILDFLCHFEQGIEENN